MIIRRYTKSDVPQMVRYLEEGLREFHYGEILYDKAKVEGLLYGNLRNPDFFCHVAVTEFGEIAGALAASVVEFMFSREAYAEHHITYVREPFRGLQVITGLVTAYRKWGKSRGLREIRWGQSTGFKMEKFSVLARRLKFSQIGTNWRMEISG